MPKSIGDRIAALDWPALQARLDDGGFVQTPPVFTAHERAELAGSFDDGRFRSTIEMRRHRFGEGTYRYFDHPLPGQIADARRALYPPLAETANRWAGQLGEPADLPAELGGFLDRCHAAGQTRPTPLLLRYGANDYNCLHQDLYGPLVFPLQLTLLLSAPGTEFSGGEFVLVEQRPRAQSRAAVVPLDQGEAVVFPVHHRPTKGTRGPYRVTMRHGVSRVLSGRRHTLGIIFHDAA